jgi:hypothetical protein
LIAGAIAEYTTIPIPNLSVLFVLSLITYAIVYINGRKYLDGFKDNRFRGDGSPNTEPPPTNTIPEMPYKIQPINDLFEYDDAAVYQNRGSKEASKKQISDAMTRYPMDWPASGRD